MGRTSAANTPSVGLSLELSADVLGQRVSSEAVQRRWALVLPYREEMLSIARRRVNNREDAEDVVATALLRTVEHPGLDEARVGPFLCSTVVRLAVDVHRQRARQLAVGVRDATRELRSVPHEDVVCDEDEARWLSKQLRNCPTRERQVLEARLSGLTTQQASQHLGLTVKAAENAYTRVRHRAQVLVTATLGGLGILLGLGRRWSKPSVAAVPLAAVSAYVLAISGGAAAAPIPAPLPPKIAQAEVAEALSVAEPVAPPPAAIERSGIPTPVTDRAAAVDAGGSPSRAASRQEVRPPAVVDRDTVDPGGVYIEHRHEESFEESLQRCIGGLELTAPAEDPCAK